MRRAGSMADTTPPSFIDAAAALAPRGIGGEEADS